MAQQHGLRFRVVLDVHITLRFITFENQNMEFSFLFKAAPEGISHPFLKECVFNVFLKSFYLFFFLTVRLDDRSIFLLAQRPTARPALSKVKDAPFNTPKFD